MTCSSASRPISTTLFGAKLKAAALLGLCALLNACASTGMGTDDRFNRLTPPPNVLPPAESSGAGALLGGVEFNASSANTVWGVGYLQAIGAGAAWTEVTFPLFDGPAGNHWGWVVDGRGYDSDRNRAAPSRENALVRIPGAGRSFIVLHEAQGGWVQVRWGEPEDFRSGVGWTHPRLARNGRLTYTSWTDDFSYAVGLVYRNADTPHNLRSGPSTDASVVRSLTGDDFDLTALAIEGDWMRVQVSSPPACGGEGDEPALLGGARPTSQVEGWVRWRSDRQGPWLRRTASAEVCSRGS